MSNAAEVLALLDKHMPDPALSKVGLAPARVRALLNGDAMATPTKFSPADARRALARAWRKSSHGSVGIPAYVVGAWHAEYCRLGSLRKAAALFDRTMQDFAYVFKQRGLPVKSRGGPNRRKAA